MIKFVSCPDCGFVNVVNVNIVDSTRDEDVVFGWLREEVTVLETDITNCRKCGAQLPK